MASYPLEMSRSVSGRVQHCDHTVPPSLRSMVLETSGGRNFFAPRHPDFRIIVEILARQYLIRRRNRFCSGSRPRQTVARNELA